MVREYQVARHADVLAMEDATLGYAAEIEEYRKTRTLITFKAWLIGLRQPREESER